MKPIAVSIRVSYLDPHGAEVTAGSILTATEIKCSGGNVPDIEGFIDQAKAKFMEEIAP